MRNTRCGRCLFLLAVLHFFLALPVVAQQEAETSPLSLGIVPGVNLPLGEDREIFAFGGGTDLRARVRLPLAAALDLSGLLSAGYVYTPVKADTAVSTISAGAGAGLGRRIFPRLSLGFYLKGGYFYSLINDTSDLPDWEERSGGGNLFLAGGLGAEFRLLPSLSLGLDAAYRENLDFSRSLVLSLGCYYHLPARMKQQGLPFPGLVIDGSRIEPVFPVFHVYYDDHSLGSAVLRNTGARAMEDIRVTLYVERYMADPKLCAAPERLEPGEEGGIELFALFNDALLEITESTKVSARISVECRAGDRQHRNTFSETLTVYDRNAMTWDDDRKAAAFVTLKDPTVLSFARAVSAAVKRREIPGVNAHLLTGLAMHQALGVASLSYVIDPTTPYTAFSRDSLAVDYLQFPRQTLEYGTGDCDDLTILTCALLEGVGIESAFVTVPGHIFAAFSLNLSPAEAKKQFLRPEDLIFLQGKTWLPLETTEIDGGFLAAWDAGARQWREHQARGQARLYPTAASWKLYPPVGLPGAAADSALPDEDALSESIRSEAERLVRRELAPRIARLQSQLDASGNSPRISNRLGVLYARYGLFDEAEEAFRAALAGGEYGPALLNLGNISFLKERYREGKEYLERAAALTPESPRLLLALARVRHALEEYALAEQTYTRLEALDPELAAQFAFLGGGASGSSRAAEAARLREVILWEEE